MARIRAFWTNVYGGVFGPFDGSKGVVPERPKEGPKAHFFDLRLRGEIHLAEEGLEAGVGSEGVKRWE